MVDLHVTPIEFGQIQDAIDQTTRTAMLIRDPTINVYAIVARVLGDDVARSIGSYQARIVVHFQGDISERVTVSA